MKRDKKSSVGIKRETLSIEYFSSIGNVVSNFVALEYSIMDTISKLISPTDTNFTYRLLAGDSFGILISKLKRIFLYQINDKLLLNEFKIIHDELIGIKNGRNKFLHSMWISNGNNITRFKLKSDIKTNPEIIDEEQIKLQDIDNFNQRIIKAIESLVDLNDKIIKLLPNNLEQNNGNDQKET